MRYSASKVKTLLTTLENRFSLNQWITPIFKFGAFFLKCLYQSRRMSGHVYVCYEEEFEDTNWVIIMAKRKKTIGKQRSLTCFYFWMMFWKPLEEGETKTYSYPCSLFLYCSDCPCTQSKIIRHVYPINHWMIVPIF
jgi:hypothetical protein